MRPIRSPLATQLDDDFLSRLRDEDLLVSSEMQAALDVCRNPQYRPAPTPRELAPQLERLAPDAESACDPNHPLTLLFGDEFLPAGPAPETLLHECVAFDLGRDIVRRDEPPLPAIGTSRGSTIPRIP